jgi:UDP-N-acetylglucosamine 1-carboxyvinyltransferase
MRHVSPRLATWGAAFLGMGARMEGVSGDVLTAVGGAPLAGAVHAIMPDRIDTGTIACAAAVTDGEVFLEHARTELLGAAAPLARRSGSDAGR